MFEQQIRNLKIRMHRVDRGRWNKLFNQQTYGIRVKKKVYFFSLEQAVCVFCNRTSENVTRRDLSNEQ